jgi:hypothetical protein
MSTSEGRDCSVDFDDETALEVWCHCEVYAVIGKGDVGFSCIPNVLNSGGGRVGGVDGRVFRGGGRGGRQCMRRAGGGGCAQVKYY